LLKLKQFETLPKSRTLIGDLRIHFIRAARKTLSSSDHIRQF
jgi:hypothetical protein